MHTATPTIPGTLQICGVGDVMQRRHTQAQSRRKFTDGVADAAPGYAVSGVSRWSRTKAHPAAREVTRKPPTTLSRLLEHEMAYERLKQKSLTPKVIRDLEAKEKFASGSAANMRQQNEQCSGASGHVLCPEK